MAEHRWGILWVSMKVIESFDPAATDESLAHLHQCLQLPARVKIVGSALGWAISDNPFFCGPHDDDIALRIEDPEFPIAEKGKLLPIIRAVYQMTDGVPSLKEWGLWPPGDSQ